MNNRIIDKIYKGNLTWIPSLTVFLTIHGSHAYGTNIEGSDVDFKGIAIPPEKYFYGFLNKFEQAEGKDPDCVIYDLRKFMILAADCNPSIIEVLWSDPLIVKDAGRSLIDHREMFLSKKARYTFSGYATAQLKRINTHYRWLKNPPKSPPTRESFGLPERTVIPADQLMAAKAAVEKKLNAWNIDILDGVDPSLRIAIQNKMTEILSEKEIFSSSDYISAARAVGYDDNFIHLLDLERQYESKKREWDQYQNWKNNRNPSRAAIEEKFGYDCKHAMHLVRLMRMCKEILSTGKVIVKRPDREELLEIRNGSWTYEQVVEWAHKEDAVMEEVYACSPLPNQPDRVRLDLLCQELVSKELSK